MLARSREPEYSSTVVLHVALYEKCCNGKTGKKFQFPRLSFLGLERPLWPILRNRLVPLVRLRLPRFSNN